jgi:hypothetical protein
VRFFFEKAKKRMSLRIPPQDRTTSRLHVERTQNELDSSGIAGETRSLSSFNHEMLRGLSMRDPQQCDYESWALAWPIDGSRKRYNDHYTESK